MMCRFWELMWKNCYFSGNYYQQNHCGSDIIYSWAWFRHSAANWRGYTALFLREKLQWHNKIWSRKSSFLMCNQVRIRQLAPTIVKYSITLCVFQNIYQECVPACIWFANVLRCQCNSLQQKLSNILTSFSLWHFNKSFLADMFPTLIAE